MPLAISIRFENEKIPLLVAGLIFGTMLWAEWLLHKANSFRDCITMEKLIETKAPHEAVKYACEHTDKIIQKIDYPTKQHFIHDICKCVECGHFLLQGQELVTLHINNNQNLPYIWAESGVWHQDCFQKHWEYSRQNKLTNDFMAASWAYLKTSINDYFTWLVPTPIHAFNYMAGAYLVYKVYKGQIPKDKMDKIWELILNK